jgi:type I restriction enzyme M protein
LQSLKQRRGVDLKDALKQGTEYAEVLECPLVFAMNGAYCETRFIPNGKELILNKNEVRELIREVECLEFIRNNTNEVCTIPEEILISREELIKSFKKFE